ncbi:hypothetical protein QUF55_07195 [Clostridiaceae bacterium HSG29]|nr:hypothetical protein [Clostridiaceae bacterium HSG29]
MKKRIFAILFISILVLGLVGCGDKFDYEKEMDEAMLLMQDVKQEETTSTIVFDNELDVKLTELAALEPENQISDEDIQKITKTLANMELKFHQKVDVEKMIIDLNMALNYEGSNFVAIDMFLNDNFIYLNEPNLLKQGVIVKFDFLNQMMTEQGGLAETIDFSKYIKDQTISQQEKTKEFFPIIDRIINANVEKPEVLETSITFEEKELKTNEVKYTLTFRETLELVKVFLKDEEFITKVNELMNLQYKNMESISGETEMEYDAYLEEFNSSLAEIEIGIDKVLTSEDENSKLLDKYNLVLSYYFKDGLKRIKFDFDFITITEDYHSINEELTFDIPDETANYVIEDQMGLFGVAGLINNEKFEELKNHKLVKDLQELQ